MGDGGLSTGAAALCYASYVISTRYLSQGEPALTNFIYSSLIGSILASILARLGLPFSPHFGPRGPRLEKFLQTLTD